ncbi:MAG: phage tail protein [Candidatus Wallbacteria bacterium]|nr:phage tail protein [Candidatus Wallbacteria bacterium]
MSDAYTGEIRMFVGNYAPVGWALCDGQHLPIAGNEVLYSLLGTTYGGNGTSTFGLPDLRGRVPVHHGQGQGLTNRQLGQMFGAETVTLTTGQIPAHTHNLMGTSDQGTVSSPAGSLLAGAKELYSAPTPTLGILDATTVQTTGGSAPHDNLMPFLCVNFIICLWGSYPRQS